MYEFLKMLLTLIALTAIVWVYLESHVVDWTWDGEKEPPICGLDERRFVLGFLSIRAFLFLVPICGFLYFLHFA